MCGLVATTLDLADDEHSWHKAMAHLTCRGPDDQGDVKLRGVRMGHRRLEIIGLGDIGHQPYLGDDKSDALVFNGEIYNYRELGQEIGIDAISDTQVLHALLSSRDFARIDRMRGMYAAAFWDSRSGELLTLRDPFGIKPLYIRTHNNGELSFASVPSAIAHLGSNARPSPVGIAGFLASGYFREGESPFDGIEKVEAGQINTWTRDSHGWRLTSRPINWNAVSNLGVSKALEDSVRLHLTSDVPVGVFLSGGVDSTLIAALASREMDGLQSFSLVNPLNPEIDEAAFARHNATLLGLRHTEVPVTPELLADQVASIVRSSGEPFGDAAYLPLTTLSHEASKHVKVVLAGEGADELFGGYKRYEVERPMYSRFLSFGTKNVARVLGRFPQVAARSSQGRRTVAAWRQGPGYLGHSQLFSAQWDSIANCLPEATNRALVRRERAWQRLQDDPFAYGLPPYQAFDLREWLPNTYLEKSDRASMLHSLEVRVPFLDSCVAETVRSSQPLNSRKEPLRRLLHELVPDVKLPPRKMGLSVVTREVASAPQLKGVVDALIGGSGGLFEEIGAINLDTLRDHSLASDGLLFRLTTLGVWANEWL